MAYFNTPKEWSGILTCSSSHGATISTNRNGKAARFHYENQLQRMTDEHNKPLPRTQRLEDLPTMRLPTDLLNDLKEHCAYIAVSCRGGGGRSPLASAWKIF